MNKWNVKKTVRGNEVRLSEEDSGRGKEGKSKAALGVSEGRNDNDEPWDRRLF